MNWINVNIQLPEMIESLIIEPEDKLCPERSVKLIVLTELGTVSDNYRLKMAVGEKEWVWFMGYEGGEKITHWMLFEEPNCSCTEEPMWTVGGKCVTCNLPEK